MLDVAFIAAFAPDLNPRDRARHLKAVRELGEKARRALADTAQLKLTLIAHGSKALTRMSASVEAQQAEIARQCAALEKVLA